MILGENESFCLSQWLKCSCKYLTYKEWKLSIKDTSDTVFNTDSKYLTYKEWKHKRSQQKSIHYL